MTTGNYGDFNEIALPPAGIDLAEIPTPFGSLQDDHKWWLLCERMFLARLSNPTLTDEVESLQPSRWLERLINGLASAGVIPKWLPGKPGEVYIEYNITKAELTILRNSIDNLSVDDMFPSV
jgi:hypothetical protein